MASHRTVISLSTRQRCLAYPGRASLLSIRSERIPPIASSHVPEVAGLVNCHASERHHSMAHICYVTCHMDMGCVK